MGRNESLVIRGPKIYSEDQVFENGYIKLVDGKIEKVGETVSEDEGVDQTILLSSNYRIIPGMIDVHIHGVAGADTMDATERALETMATELPKEATTSFLATTMTQSPKKIEKALSNATQYLDNQLPGKAELLGIHLEGPFISPKKAGAQPSQYIMDPTISLFKKWQDYANGQIKFVTTAPEQPNGIEFIRYLHENGVVVSIGHSDASYHDMNKAIEAGATHITHLFNAMTGLHHRDLGVAGAAFLRKELYVEIIPDGIHVCPDMVNLSYQQVSPERLILITDSMRAKCLKEGTYDLGEQLVHVKDGKALLGDGTLAGSILKMMDGAKNVLTFTGCSLNEIIQMTAVNPAKQLDVFDRKGSIKKGKDADLVIIDEQMNIVMTLCRGVVSYLNEKVMKTNEYYPGSKL
jgi:N-acetylglucosamine-6-phosphate deacetylase